MRRLVFFSLLLSAALSAANTERKRTVCDYRKLFFSSLAYPSDPAQITTLRTALLSSVYRPVIEGWKAKRAPLTPEEEEKIWRMAVKTHWRLADKSPAGSPPERRIKFTTNEDRRAYQSGGLDESADASPPFVMKESDPRPAGMPAGTYSLSSGKSGFLHETVNEVVRNGKRERFEFEVQHVTPDGKVVIQRGGYAAPDSSWGWDGRFEMQPNPHGGYDLVFTQGAMELPVNVRGQKPGTPELPEVAKNNSTRSRHVFTLKEWVPAKDGKPAKLVVRDTGSILDMRPSHEHQWIETDETGTLLHAHGYGENFWPDPNDSRKMWIDPDGYSWRIFDQVTRQTTMLNPDGSKRYVPTETRAVAYRMDPKNPSRIVPAGVKLPNGKAANEPVFMTSNFLPGTNKPLPATVRYLYPTHGKIIEERFIDSDGKVKIITEGFEEKPALLNEGFNPVPGGAVPIGSKKYFLGTNSGGEYTSGGLPAGKDTTKYGGYLWYRDAKDGPIGEFQPVLTKDGRDLHDMFGELTEMYGLSWGIGRPQAFQDEQGHWWIKAHGVDVDLLPDTHPQSGYPPTAKQFSDDYRRQQMAIPISWVEVNGKPAIKVDDPNVQRDLEAWRLRRPRR